MTKLVVRILILLVALYIPQVFAQVTPEATAQLKASNADVVAFNDTQRALIIEAQKYLSSIKTLEAKFSQISPNDVEITSGQFYLSKPGNLLVRYESPYKIDYFIKGDYLIQYDYDLDQIGRGEAPENPMKVLLYDDVNLVNNPLLTLVAVKHDESAFELLMVTKDKELEEDITGLALRFSKNPVKLIAVSRMDVEGEKIEMNLSAVKENPELDKDMFRFIRPKKKYPNSPNQYDLR